ncbi:apoptosis-antagonizing transcription factor [Globomyces pollinis-pini]|nr:apoptosis-antagonizing transcription factor [Globomyces pollinis-pini]
MKLDISGLDNTAPDWDPEGDREVDSDAESNDGANSHYVTVNKSSIRNQLELPLDPKLIAKKVSRADLYEEEEERDFDSLQSEQSSTEGDNSDDEIQFDSDEVEKYQNGISSEDNDDINGKESDSDDQEDGGEEDDESDSNEPLELNLISKLVQNADEKKMIKKITNNAKDDIEKGHNVKNQLSVWDTLLDTRIKFQKILESSNCLPQNDYYEDFVQGLLVTNDQIPGIESMKRKHDEVEVDEWIVDTWENVLTPMQEGFRSYRNDTLEKWNSKVQIANGIPLQKKFKVINQSVVSQIEDIVQGEGEVRDKHLNDYDENIYDDGDYYQQLLKELIESRLTTSDDPVQLGMRYAQLKQLQNKKNKKQVDTRASKGRKIRYQIQEKIQNFMTPEPRGTWHDGMVTELFSSLFGQNLHEFENETIEDIPLDGFKLMI